MKYSVISADIIASTSLSTNDKTLLNDKLWGLIGDLEVKYDFYGRIIKGDYIECVILPTILELL